MSHFAKIENNIVTQVIVAQQDHIDTLEGQWIQTSYNTRGNVHYGEDGEPDGGIALRGNYAGIGYVYDSTNDVFYLPKPHNSWTLNRSTWTWEAPTEYPLDGKKYHWSESDGSWKEMPTKQVS